MNIREHRKFMILSCWNLFEVFESLIRLEYAFDGATMVDEPEDYIVTARAEVRVKL